MTIHDVDPPRKSCLRHILASRLRDLRHARRWSQEDLADASGLHRTYIGMIEREERSIGIDKLECLAKAFGIPVTELVRDSCDALGRDSFVEKPTPV